jgi:haloacid dehalogenase superfamily, subfamily IA, variant 3 with third motif having DD or ED
MQTLKAIIFDVDGTLANTEEIHRQSFNSAFAEFSIDCEWSEKEYADLLSISGGRERIIAYFKNRKFALRGDLNLRELSLRIHRRKSEIYREKLLGGHIGLRAGVHRLITEAEQQGIKLGIATCSSMKNVETLLNNTLGDDALSRFNTVVTSDVIEDKKPSPAVYQYALAKLALSPQECIAIEDTTNGNRAAQSCGITTIITTHCFTAGHDFSGARLVLDQLGEPKQPFRIISGNAYGSHYVNIGLLDRILSSQAEEQYHFYVDSPAVAGK